MSPRVTAWLRVFQVVSGWERKGRPDGRLSNVVGYREVIGPAMVEGIRMNGGAVGLEPSRSGAGARGEWWSRATVGFGVVGSVQARVVPLKGGENGAASREQLSGVKVDRPVAIRKAEKGGQGES